MTSMTTIILLAIAGLVVIVLLVSRWNKTLKPETRHLAMSVWAAFGPYDSPDDAEYSLNMAVQAVFGSGNMSAHEDWINGHLQNFHLWKEEGRFQDATEMMRSALLQTAYGDAFDAACNDLRNGAITQLNESTEFLNKRFLEGGGHKLEVIKNTDGTAQVQYNQIWSDEDVQRKKKENSKAILQGIGNSLWADNSVEAIALITFLREIYNANADKELETPEDIGTAWIASNAALDEDPESELAKEFEVFNNAWLDSRQD